MPLADRLETLMKRRVSAPRLNPEPIYLREPQPLPMPVVVPEGSWRGFFRGLASDTELVLLAGVLAALCGWFVLSVEPLTSATVQRQPVSLAETLPARPDEPYMLVSVRARDWLLPAMLAFEPRPPLQPLAEHLPAPPVMASIEQHALIVEPILDPLGSVVLSGLPPSSRLSAGAELTPAGSVTSDWAVAFGDLDNLIVELPRDRTGPIRTTLDLRTRAGVKIASLTVEVRDTPAGVAAPDVTPKKSDIRPVRALQGQGKPLRKSVRSAPKAVVPPDPPYPGDPPKVVASPVAPSKPSPGPFSVGPLGIFKPDPKDTATSGLSPSSREDPRFTTLRGLGMSPAVAGLDPEAGASP